MARIRDAEGTRTVALVEGWEFAGVAPGKISHPTELEGGQLEWCPAKAPSTVASALRAVGRWSIDDRIDFDASDWWYRCRFAGLRSHEESAVALRFGGLATLANVWLNGRPILASENMFLEHDVDVSRQLEDTNELVLRFRSVGSELQVRRPRPRWRTRLVSTQQLRWIRTTLLGRIPGWTPPAAPVGPWRPIVLEERTRLAVSRADIRSRLVGDDGWVDVDVLVSSLDGRVPQSALLHVGSHQISLSCTPEGDSQVAVRGMARLPVM